MATFEFKLHWLKAKITNLILQDTSAQIEIIVDNTCVTKHVDSLLGGGDKVCISAYPLAYWFAYFWWRLSYELLPVDFDIENSDWFLAHSLGAANWNYAFPSILFISDGEIIQIQPSPFHDTGRSLNYSSSIDRSLDISIEQFQFHVERFIEEVLNRLDDCNHPVTELKTVWEIVKKDRSHSEVCKKRRVEAMLGNDPGECPLEFN
ncbi:MAG: hypothetical protein EOO53_14090 [Gammaproteobacteria bacterium]|nr:MAG: hypothetical protein EOO53_14090 [Gammaproteobacteria bacterium]